jgi:nitrite reductase (NADH) large subunit
VGIICVDSGYQIGVGGAAGMDLKETERLAAVATEDEAIALTVAFIQLYRENARYLDRPYKWLKKVGLDWVKDRVLDPEIRAGLIERFDLSQSVCQKDPWAERATPEAARRFHPLATLMQEAAE